MEVAEEDAMKWVFTEPGWSLGTNQGQEASRRWTKLGVTANGGRMGRELAGESHSQMRGGGECKGTAGFSMNPPLSSF